MEKVNYRITLDVHKGGIQKKISGFFTGDVLSRRIAIGLAARGVTCKLEGDNVVALMYVTKPNEVTNYGECEIIDNTVYYDVIRADTDVEGVVEMQLKVMSNDMVLYAPMFSLEVRQSNSDSSAEASPQFTALEAAILKANEGKITPKGEWDPDTEYKELDHVTHNGSSFVALKPSVGIAPVNGEHWMVSLNGVVDFKLLADGSVPAGDAKQLGGKNADLYASKEEVANVDKKVAEIANNQIPEEYLEAAVDKYVEDNSAGFATRASLEAVETDLKSDLSEVVDMVGVSVSVPSADSIELKLTSGTTYILTNTGSASGSFRTRAEKWGDILESITIDANSSVEFTPTVDSNYVFIYVANNGSTTIDVVEKDTLSVEFKEFEENTSAIIYNNLDLAQTELVDGYLNGDGSASGSHASGEKRTGLIKCEVGKEYVIVTITSGVPWSRACEYKGNVMNTTNFLLAHSSEEYEVMSDGRYWHKHTFSITDENAVNVAFSFRTYTDGEAYIFCLDDNVSKAFYKNVEQVFLTDQKLKEEKSANSPFYACVTPRKTRSVQHRGLTALAPENSIPAFEKAGENGYFGVELDVRRTSDGVLVVCHDATIDRTTNGTGSISAMTYAELSTYRIDTGNNISDYRESELRIPTLEETLKICKKHGMFAVIEMKVIGDSISGTVKNIIIATIDLLKNYSMEHSAFLMVNTMEQVDYIKAIAPTVHTQILKSITENEIEQYSAYKNFGATIGYSDYEDKEVMSSIIRNAESKGFLISVFGVTTESIQNEVIDMLPDFVITDIHN